MPGQPFARKLISKRSSKLVWGPVCASSHGTSHWMSTADADKPCPVCHTKCKHLIVCGSVAVHGIRLERTPVRPSRAAIVAISLLRPHDDATAANVVIRESKNIKLICHIESYFKYVRKTAELWSWSVHRDKSMPPIGRTSDCPETGWKTCPDSRRSMSWRSKFLEAMVHCNRKKNR